MTKRIYKITGEASRQAAKRAIDDAQIGQWAVVQDKTRTLEQNAMLHPLLTDISKQKLWMGERISMLQWKNIMVSGHAIATGNPSKITVGIEGEVVNLRESTTAMSTKRFSSLMEYVLAWGAMNGVEWSKQERIAA